MFDPSATHIIILFIVVLLLFGSRRLPGAAKSLGQSMHIFKKSIAGLDEDAPDAASGTAANQAPAAIRPTTTLPPALPLTDQVAPAQDQSAQIQELQRQVEELQRQTTGGAGQSSQPF
jgi:sec-independent protein translocase protein TatA